jgi:FAD/FMN-containing dehydrogenase
MKKYFLLLLLLTSKACMSATDKEWTNWLGNQTCSPARYYEPATIDQIHDCILEAVSMGRTIRVVGGGYSISALVPTAECLLSLKNFNKILSIDTNTKLVRVEAGITMGELNRQLASHNLALPNQAAIDTICLGGALATATHGMGHTGTLSNFIKKIELITANGKMLELSPTTDDKAFAAAKVSLGALGIIYAVTLQCESLFYLQFKRAELDLESFIREYKKYIESNDFVQFIWNVTSNRVTVEQWNRCSKTDAINNLPTNAEVCYKALAYHTPDIHDKDLFSEITIPLDALPRAINAIQTFVKKHQNQGRNIADIVMRYVEADEDGTLSPAAGRSVMYITMSASKETCGIDFYEEFEKLLHMHQGRPHWGKINFLDYKKALRLYGENLKNFMHVKQQLDPQGLFSNAFIKQIFPAAS